MSRAQILLDRNSLRGSPASQTSSFPRPRHSLFSEQDSYNHSLISQLSAEIELAKNLARQAHDMAVQYSKACEVIATAERMQLDMEQLTSKYHSLLAQLKGSIDVVPATRETARPDFDDLDCLNSYTYSTYISLLPSYETQLERIERDYDELSEQAAPVINSLSSMVVRDVFLTSFAQYHNGLKTTRAAVLEERRLSVQSVSLLERLRNLWEHILQLAERSRGISNCLNSSLELVAPPRRHSLGLATPPPENITVSDPPVKGQHLGPVISEIETELKEQVEQYLEQGLSTIGKSLCVRELNLACKEVRRYLRGLKDVDMVFGKLKHQMAVLDVIQKESKVLEEKFLHQLSLLDQEIEHPLLLGYHTEEALVVHMKTLDVLKEDLQYFLDQIPGRIPFLNVQHTPVFHSKENILQLLPPRA